MSERKHIEGPWRLRVKKDEPYEFEAQICGDVFILADFTGPNYPHQRPTALLMTAAPDMLEALERLRDNFIRLLEQKPVRDAAETLAEADRAIAKAKGQTP